MKAPNGVKTNLSEDLWVAVRTPFFKKWFGDWEKKVERPVGGAPSEDSAPFTSDQSQPPRVSHGYREYSTENPNVKFLLDENGEPLVVHHGTNARFLYFSVRCDIGYHFGAEEYAENRTAVVSEENGGTPGIYSGFVSMRNPLYISTDFGSWRGNDAAAKLLERNAPMEASVADLVSVLLTGITESRSEQKNKPFLPKDLTLTEEDVARLKQIQRMGSWDANGALVTWLKEKGYDGIVYENSDDFEGKGKSFLVFAPSQFKSVDNFGTFSNEDNGIYYQTTELPIPKDGKIEDEDYGLWESFFEARARNTARDFLASGFPADEADIIKHYRTKFAKRHF